MRCDECKWWDEIGMSDMVAMNLNEYTKRMGAGNCRLEPKSEMTLSIDRCRHFDQRRTLADYAREGREKLKPKTPEELLDKAKDLFPQTEPAKPGCGPVKIAGVPVGVCENCSLRKRLSEIEATAIRDAGKIFNDDDLKRLKEAACIVALDIDRVAEAVATLRTELNKIKTYSLIT